MRATITNLGTIVCVAGATFVTCVASAETVEDALFVHFGGEIDALGLSVCRAGDYNGDGICDYAVSAPLDSLARGYVQVRSGAHGGVMRELIGPNSFEGFGWSVACAGDVNNDGRDDVIVGSPFCDTDDELYTLGAVTVFAGGSGAVLHRIMGAYDGGMFGWSVAGAGDVDGDGHDDFIVGVMSENNVGGENAGAVRVYSGANGVVLFGAAGPSVDANLGVSVEGIGDVTGDGYDDVAAGAYGIATVYIYDAHNHTVVRTLTNGVADSFFGYSITNAGDVTLDGVPDLAVGAPQEDDRNGRVYVYDGVSGSQESVYSVPGALQFGYSVDGGVDVSGDDIPDIAMGSNGGVQVRSGFDGAIARVLSGGTSEFGTSVALLESVGSNSLAGIVVGDFFHGHVDGAAYVFEVAPNEFGLGMAQTLWNAGPSPGFIASADFNHDGLGDLVTISTSMDRFSLLFRNDDGTYSAGGTYATGDGPTAAAAADFDHDGDIDLAVAVANENRVKLYRNSGAGFMLLMGDIKVGRRPSFVIAADLNGDGFKDLATTDKLDNSVTVLLHNRHVSPPLHQQFLPKRTFMVGDGPVHLAAGYFNADGRIDLIVANETGNSLTVLNSTAPGVFNNRKDTPTDAKPACLAVSDFDGDGFTDVGYICRGIDKAHVRLGKNNGTFNTVKKYVVGAGPCAIVAVDIDVNDHADLAVCNYASHSVSLLLNNAAGQFDPPLPYYAGVNPMWICTDDIDGDFDDDIVTIGKTIPTASVLLNTWF